ncbi:Uu.00g129830.m01.CDS01 [Anthostomella pinea]|uniref:Uu.00g129830.m01.CDS01 n=1 Tax=Anthostomella pinea TaxID=933095 RepID=A0AAI8VJP8_9PEZI|nr:Uu.00g129830.m01.CDS01 [Anthostomella pinea]
MISRPAITSIEPTVLKAEHMSTLSPPGLYPGEGLIHIADAPCIYRFFPADKKKPLIVLIPGGAHNARIFYGGHRGYDSDDFLASWLVKDGFGVLGISYPLQSEPELMPPVAPAFRIHQWGKQAAEVTKAVVDANSLCGDIVLVCWSMGGRLLVPYCKLARGLGLNVKLFVSLAATPGLAGIRPVPPGLRSTPSGYATFPAMLGLFTAQIREQQQLNHDKCITPEGVYRSEYFGHTPVSLLGWGYRFDGMSEFADDGGDSVRDAEAHNVGSLPWISSLTPTSQLDARHVLSDKATWAFLMTQRLTLDFEKKARSIPTDSFRWMNIRLFVESAPGTLSAPVTGNHYFFLGKSGAKATAKGIARHLSTATALESRWCELLGD